MKKFHLRKGNKVRLIYSLTKKEKRNIERFKSTLEFLALTYCNGDIVHGFMPLRSNVTNAIKHIGFDYTASFDLKNFFDTITIDSVKKYINDDNILKSCFVNGRLPQGFSTSPIISNIAMIDFDEEILINIHKLTTDIVYTRYADDLTFSFNDKNFFGLIRNIVSEVTHKYGLIVNKKKTKFFNSGSGNRTVTGISVGKEEIHVPRHIKRKMRAAKHQGNQFSLNGLEEYSKFKHVF